MCTRFISRTPTFKGMKLCSCVGMRLMYMCCILVVSFLPPFPLPIPQHTREVLHYDDVTIPLTLSDVDSLQNKPKPQSVPGKDNYSPETFPKFDVGSKVSLSVPSFV